MARRSFQSTGGYALCIGMHLNEIRDTSPKHGKSLWHLKSDSLDMKFSNLMDCLVDFERVVLGEECVDRGIDERIL